MALSRNINAYRDIQTLLEQSIAAGGATLEFPDINSARAWQQRANFYRILLGASPFDSLLFSRRGTQVQVRSRELPAVTFHNPIDSITSTAPDPFATARRLLHEKD